MNILYLTQYFPPDKGAAQIRAWEMAQNLTRLGHKITVVTEFPNHPLGIIPPKYKLTFFARELLDGVEVIRCYVKPSPRKNLINRMVFHLSFLLTSIIAAAKLKSRYDLVYATSSPLFVGLSGHIIGKMKGIPFVFEVRDLWLDAAVALGEAKNKLFIRAARWMENLCYHGATRVVAVTKGCYRNALEKRLDPKKAEIVYNGANVDLFKPLKDRREIKRKHGYEGKFVVLYAGNFGLVHGMHTLVETVSLMVGEKQTEFLFVGEGPLKAEVMRLREERPLPNLKVLDDVPTNQIVEYINLADVCLVPAKRNQFSCVLLPVKMFDAWACGRPIILSVDGEAQEHLKKAQAGLWVEPEDSRGIADAIRYLSHNPELGEEYGKNGREYVKRHFSRRIQAERLERILLQIASRP